MDAAQQVLGGDSGQGRPTRHQAFDAQAYRITVSVLPRFESQTLISQSTRADETHRSFDRQFNPTVQNHFLSVILARREARLIVRQREKKSSRYSGAALFVQILCQ